VPLAQRTPDPRVLGPWGAPDLSQVAALYVDAARGAYSDRKGVEVWGFATRDGAQQDLFCPTRDARLYAGPLPVVAHPPCGPWGRFSWNYKGGEGSQSCGPLAIKQIRALGGVLEHPAYSKLWKAGGLPPPGEGSDHFGGWTLAVNQCDFGHPAKKPTWLYICGTMQIPLLPPPVRPTHVMVRLLRNRDKLPELAKKQRHLTPPRFAEFLIDLASRCVRA